MRLYDFSDNDFNCDYITDSTYVISSLPYIDKQGKEVTRMIISELDNRLVFLLPEAEIIELTGYDDYAVKNIIKTFVNIKDELNESINLVESDTYRKQDSNRYKYLPKVIELKRKDIWNALQFRYFDKKYFKARPVIILDASDSKEFKTNETDRGLIMAMKITSKKKEKDSKGKEILDDKGNPKYKKARRFDVDLVDWRKEGLSKPSYARTDEIQQLPIERFLPNKFYKDYKPKKLGQVSVNDWNKIEKVAPNINNLKITSKSDTTTNYRVVNIAKKIRFNQKDSQKQNEPVNQKLVACYNLLKTLASK